MAVELDQEVVWELLGDQESIIPRLAEQDEDARAKISSRECPHCGEPLSPRIPQDPKKVFGKIGINYEAVCPAHGVIE